MLQRLNSWRRSASNTSTASSPPLKPPKPSPTTTLRNEGSAARIVVQEEALSPSTSLEGDSGYLLEWGKKSGKRSRGRSVLLFEDVSLFSDEDDEDDEEDEEGAQGPPEEPSTPPRDVVKSPSTEAQSEAQAPIQEDKRQEAQGRRPLFSLPSMSLPSFSSLPPPPAPPAPTPLATEEQDGVIIEPQICNEPPPTPQNPEVSPAKPTMPPRTASLGARFMPTLLKKSSSVSSSPAANEDNKGRSSGLSRVTKGLTDFLFEPDAPFFPPSTSVPTTAVPPTQHKKA